MAEFSITFPIAKAEAEGDEVTFTGWAAISTDEHGIPVIDHDGQILPVTVLEKAVHKAAQEAGGMGRGGDMHVRKGAFDIVESLVVTREKRAALGFGEGQEGWIITGKSRDPKVIAAVRSGDKLELSIFGRGAPVSFNSASELANILRETN